MDVIFSGWFLVNILAPVALPIFGVVVLKLVPLPDPPENLRIMTTVKDGQLCWAAVAMCTATIYDCWSALEAKKVLAPWVGFALATSVVVMLPAMLLASAGAIFSTPLIDAAPGTASRGGRIGRWLTHYKMFVASAILTILAAYILTIGHFATG